MRVKSLCDEDTSAHCYTAVRARRAMSIDFAAVADCFQRGVDSAVQVFDGDWYQRRVKGWEPEQVKGSWMRVFVGASFHAHVDDQFDAESTQVAII